MLKLVFIALTFLAAYAEDKTCAVKGMHCAGCAEMVQGKVCDEGKYTTCDVKLIDEKKELGQMHLITKDTHAQIDEKALDNVLADTGYKLDKCTSKKQ